MENENKATAIEKRHSHQCQICMAIDSSNKDLKFFIFEEGILPSEEDKEICENCLKDLVAIRAKCNLKINNPSHDPFEDFTPSFVKDMPGLREAFKKILA